MGMDGPDIAVPKSLLPDGVRAYAIGDIHGRADLLEKLFNLLRSDIMDREFKSLYFVFMGDYIDRGFHSRAVIDLLLKQDWGSLKAVFLKGNHEQTLLDFLKSPEVGPQWIGFGGRETLISYGVKVPDQKSDLAAWEVASKELRERMPERHLKFLNQLNLHFELGNCYFVHAGVDPQRDLDDQTDQDRMWIRDRFIGSTKKLSKVIVHGHSPEDKPVWDGRRIGVDTGAYITNRLTAARIQGTDIEFFST